MTKSTDDTPKGELILYQTEDGRTRIECRFEGETVWLTQALIANLFQRTPQNITQHLREIYTEGELDERQLVRRSYKFELKARGRSPATTRPAVRSIGIRRRSRSGIRQSESGQSHGLKIGTRACS